VTPALPRPRKSPPTQPIFQSGDHPRQDRDDDLVELARVEGVADRGEGIKVADDRPSSSSPFLADSNAGTVGAQKIVLEYLSVPI
jgi:hypothetical protein